jgi:hypothetical protein
MHLCVCTPTVKSQTPCNIQLSQLTLHSATYWLTSAATPQQQQNALPAAQLRKILDAQALQHLPTQALGMTASSNTALAASPQATPHTQ